MAAYTVSQRMRELAIHVALCAQRKEVLQAALGPAFKLLASGSAVTNSPDMRECFRRQSLSFDGCRRGGYRRHARTIQSDHGVNVLDTNLSRCIHVQHLGKGCDGRIVKR
jgi:hypothetical protein